mgnify:CR=1 FL=1
MTTPSVKPGPPAGPPPANAERPADSKKAAAEAKHENKQPASFATLVQQIEIVRTQNRVGLRVLKRVQVRRCPHAINHSAMHMLQRFIARYAKLQEGFAWELQKSVQIERGKLDKLEQEDMMSTTWTSVTGFFERQAAKAMRNLELAKELNQTVVDQLSSCYQLQIARVSTVTLARALSCFFAGACKRNALRATG